jgi:type IV pilus assembly protein PilQ
MGKRAWRSGCAGCALLLLSIAFVHAQDRVMSIDVKDTDIRDAIRMISKGYDLNIILDKEVSGSVTLHLVDVPIMEGLQSLAGAQGLEVVQEGSVYRIRTKSETSKTFIRYANGELTVDVQNMDVLDFIRELSSKSSMSIVPDNKVSGKVTGKLFGVKLDDGIRALLEGNGLKVIRRRNIYQVSSGDEGGSGSSGMDNMGMNMRRRMSTGSNKDFFVEFSQGRLTIEVSNANLEDVLKAITDNTDIEIVTYGSISEQVNAKLFDKEIGEAFALLLAGTRFTFVERGNIILIGDRNAATPSGQALSKTELIHLSHIKADGVPQILPQNIPANNIKVIKEQNALLVSGTSEDIAMAREFLASVDIPTPQVRLDAVIVEYKENLDKERGFEYWHRPDRRNTEYAVLPSPSTHYSKDPINYVELATSGKFIKQFLPHDGGILKGIPDDFFMIVRMLESQDKAKVLAQPSIVTLNGHKASIIVDETQYFKIVTGTEENLAYRFQPIQFGIKLDITPWISKTGQITAEIQPEVSNSEKTNAEGFPNVSKRSLTTTVRLNNGETIALGGLIKNSEERFASKVPFLGDIPLLGMLFQHSGTRRSKTNLVIYITPRVMMPGDTVDIEDAMNSYDLSNRAPLERVVVKASQPLFKGRIKRHKLLPHPVDTAVVSQETVSISIPQSQLSTSDSGHPSARETVGSAEQQNAERHIHSTPAPAPQDQEEPIAPAPQSNPQNRSEMVPSVPEESTTGYGPLRRRRAQP